MRRFDGDWIYDYEDQLMFEFDREDQRIEDNLIRIELKRRSQDPTE